MDKTSELSRGKAQIDARTTGRFRLKIPCVHEDQLELIMMALERARMESETQYDAVALTKICVHYLAHG